MKVLLVNKFHYIKGGSETYYFGLGELLKKHGCDVVYFPRSILRAERIVWIDLVKGYAMLFVLLHHISFTPAIYRTFYAPFFLTAFFVTAGYTFSSKKVFSQFLLRKVKSLLVPLFTLGIICIVFSQILSFNEQTPFLQQVIELLVQNGTAGHRLWFVAAMFVACCIFYPISKLNRKWLTIICVLFMALNIGFRKYICTAYLPWHLSVMGAACFWMGVGFYMKKYVQSEQLTQILKSRRILFGVTLLYFVVLCLACFIGNITYIGFSDFIVYPVLYFILNGLGILLLLCICNQKYSKLLLRFLAFVGQNTLFYFAFHGKVESLLLVICKRLGIFMTIQNYNYILAPGLAIAESLILIIPCIIFTKCLPFAVGKECNWKLR